MKRFILSLYLILTTIIVFGQNLKDFSYFYRTFHEETYLSIFPTFTMVRNNDAPHPSAHALNGFTGKIEMRKINFDSGEKQYIYQHKLLFDMFLIVDDQINGDGSDYYRSETSGLTNGMIGWYSFGWNIISGDRFVLNAGINLNDYFLSNSYQVDSILNSLVSFEPQGYWFAAGPSFILSYSLNQYFIIQSHVTYSVGYWRAVSLSYAGVQEDDGYPHPHFGGLSLEIQSKYGLYAGIDHNWLINRGDIPNNTRRTDLFIGFRFPI